LQKTHRASEKKSRLDLDDVNLLQEIDEAGHFSSVPSYAMDNLNEILVAQLDEGGLSLA